jgi:hypothetical protein
MKVQWLKAWAMGVAGSIKAGIIQIYSIKQSRLPLSVPMYA